MNTKFIVNDYILIWNLLFGASISEPMYKLKQKIWDTYKNEYNSTFQDKLEILKDYKNFIPNNDTVYNIIIDTKDYEKLKKQAEASRIELMQIWDKNKKETENLMKNIIRKKLPNYKIFVVNKELNVIDHPLEGVLIVGREINKKEPLKVLLEMNAVIVKNNIKRYKEDYEKFKKAILEFAVLNEYATRIMGRSCYQVGSPNLQSLKRWLYPYWLMYLGVPKEEFYNYMTRDKIVFDADKYAYEKELKRMDIEEFIEFCIRNQRYIIRENRIPKLEEDVI